MILYFSGTGNSRRVAETLHTLLDEQMFCMEHSYNDLPPLADDESLGIVFPVYAWGVPKIVEEFLADISVGDRYVWAVMTCGDDMGYADNVLEKIIRRKVNAAFSVQMPNTYVCLPGFDVDAPELAAKKQRETAERLPSIAERIKTRATCRELTRGGSPWMKTYVIRPLFNKFLVTDKYFKTSADCNACGLCAKRCPVGDIELCDARPSWRHQNCTGCLRCYHNCPKRAIEWGAYTKRKGQSKLV